MCSFSSLDSRQYKVRKVVIDAGHGGKDPGKLGSNSKEKDVALSIALKVGEYIEKYLDNVEVIYTRKDDSFVELIDRASIANKNDADLFISIHANGHNTSRPAGTETYVMGNHVSQANLDVAKRENSVILLEENYEEKYEGFDPNAPDSHILFSLYQSAYLESSLMMARNVESQFKNRVGRKSRGVKQAGFIVLYKTSMPSVLIELGFMSNQEEEKYLNSEEGQTYMASGIFRAFRDYKEEIESMN
ncbi:MAG: N-acetylmuramoyl-L-alanine amidase [Cyclobacteriaceae bacterium]